MPSMLLDFRSSFDAQYQLPDWYYNALLMDRASLASADALRSLVFILLGAALLFWFYTSKDRKKVATFVGIGVAVLMLVDLWTVDKRYLNDSNFIRQKPTEVYKETVADQEIMKDKDLSYRVLNLNNPFKDGQAANAPIKSSAVCAFWKAPITELSSPCRRWSISSWYRLSFAA